MPFDFAAPGLLAPGLLAHVDAATLAGVPRHLLERHALEQLPPAMRGALAEIELTEAGQFVHMGMNFDQVAWRAVWRRPGLPGASGTIPVWHGEIV
jgi:hypothetical protein